MKQRAAQVISYAFMPTTFALVAFVLLAFLTEQGSSSIEVAFAAVLFGAVLPFLYLFFLLLKERVTKIDVPVRQQRTVPYLVTAVIYFAGFLVLYYIRASAPVYALMFCYMSNTLVLSLVNTKWKISAHAMGAAGPLTLLAMVFGWQVVPAFVVVAVVAWARVELKAHTTAQVVAGSALGIILTGVQLELLFKYVGGV